MKRKIGNVWNQKCLRLLVLAFVMLSFLSGQKVKADDSIWVKNNFKESVVYSAYKEDKYIFHIYDISDSTTDIVIKQSKTVSSNKSVATVENFGGNFGFSLYPKKTGTTKITWTAVVNGKKIKRTGTVKVIKYQNPFATLKLGGKNYLPELEKGGRHNSIEIKSNKSKVKLEYKLKSGWKVVDVYAGLSRFNVDSGSTKEAHYEVKNGNTYQIRYKDGKGPGTFSLYWRLKNKKGIEIDVSLHCGSL